MTTLPHARPDFDMQEFEDAAEAFLEAGQRYWEAMRKAGLAGGTVWLSATDGGMAIFTRGEYRETLMTNIHRLGEPTFHFGGTMEEEFEE